MICEQSIKTIPYSGQTSCLRHSHPTLSFNASTSKLLQTLSLLIASLCFISSTALAAERYTSQDLPQCRDKTLQQQLESLIDSQGLRRAAKQGRLSASLVDITDLASPRYASVNGTQMMYAASLPKIALLLGAYETSERRHQPIDSLRYDALIDMIRHSSNTAATEIYNWIGPARLASILTSRRYRLYDLNRNGGLWVGKPYSKSRTWQRDPLHNTSHGANAEQVARFYYLLETGQLVSARASREMKDILSEPSINHKFVKGLEQRPGSIIYRKSGSWRSWHSDSAIIERGGRRYIAVVLANDSKGGEWISDLIVGFDDLIYSSPQLAIGSAFQEALNDGTSTIQ